MTAVFSTGRSSANARLVRRALALVVLLTLFTLSVATADDEAPTLPRALFLEKTAHDPTAAAEVFGKVAADRKADAATRAEARLGQARCLLAIGKESEAEAAWKSLEDDPDAPTAAKEEARTRRAERQRERTAAAEKEADAKDAEAVRRAEEARVEHENRVRAASVLVDRAKEHVKEKRYEQAREALLEALQLNPTDERAVALLDEVSAFGDRGEILRQAMHFVATNRVVDFRRLSSGIDRLRDAAKRLLREEKPEVAAASLRDAIARIDESDFYADLADRRRELVVLLRKAVDDASKKGVALADVSVPAERTEATPVRPWRAEFYKLLARIVTTGAAPETALRFYDATVPPNPTPEGRGSGFTAGSPARILASPSPGSLRRARWIERYIRSSVAAGTTWTGRDRLLERYDDQIVVEHTATVLREVDALVDEFEKGPPPPARVEIRVFSAAPGGVAEAVRLLDVRATPSDPGTGLVVRGKRIEEQERIVAASDAIRLIAQASVRLTGRHATLVRFSEPTAGCPYYGALALDAEARAAAPIVIPDRDATYGLDLDLFAEDLPGARASAAISVVATVKRPERPRVVPLASGNTRIPVFVTQTVEADRKVPHAGSLMLLSLSNPFREGGAAGDLNGGTHPDLIVLVSAMPADGAAAPDIPANPGGPSPGSPDGTTGPSADRITREYELGVLGTEIVDEPAPEAWPSSSFADASRIESGRLQRDAFLAGVLAERARMPRSSASLFVRDGRLTATASAEEHERLTKEIERLVADEGRLFTIEVRATEMPAEHASALLAEAGVRTPDAAQRLFRLDERPAAAIEQRLKDVPDAGSLYATTARLAARHTQLVTTRMIRARSIVEDFRIVPRVGGGPPRTVPVNGTAEEGLVVAVRPVASVAGLASLDVLAILAHVERVEQWTPAGAPGDPQAAPKISLPRHSVERAAGQGTFGERDTIVLVIPAPGTDGARTVLIRVRHFKP